MSASFAIFAINFALIRGNALGFGSRPILIAFAVSLCATILCVAAERRAAGGAGIERSLFPRAVIASPANYRRAVMLTYEQFRYSFANAVSENEARRLYEAYPVPGSGIPLFQAATANINPLTEIKVDTRNPHRGPMLLITGEKDHIAPHAIAAASYRKQKRNPAATQLQEIPDRGHSLVFDSGWQDVAETALAFIKTPLRRS